MLTDDLRVVREEVDEAGGQDGEQQHRHHTQAAPVKPVSVFVRV